APIKAECKTLPEGFWSAVAVWIKKPHVINKRLCGVKETESRNVDREALGLFVNGLSDTALDFVSSGHKDTHENGKEWSYNVRTFIPKVNCYGSKLHKEAILKCKDPPQVTFLPFEEDEDGHVSYKESNIYQFRLTFQDAETWFLEFHGLSTDEWFSDGIAYPKLHWLRSDLLPKLVRWATECKTSEFKSTLSLLPVEKYSVKYQQLKEKYKALVKVWPEVTDPEKFVYEDVAIATYLLVLWSEERREKDLNDPQSFVDLGCGNGLLVHILINEGHPGKGIDVRRRKIWDMYGPQTVLEEEAITPSESFLFPDADWLIGNHSDELTPWIPVIAARPVIKTHNLSQNLKCQLLFSRWNYIMGLGSMCEKMPAARVSFLNAVCNSGVEQLGATLSRTPPS
uniref:tRNA (uracil-O(2)-)-methyltransferase n=1 Tax=Neogobius melanostomus TaxID=47308 RepID=A0A8C6WSR8_9GOBI